MRLKQSIFISLIVSGSLITTFARAQDYPYEDKPADALKNDSGKEELPKEVPYSPPNPSSPTGSSRKKSRTVQRFSIKAGGTVAILQDNLSGSVLTAKGMGFEGLLALGWDLAYQPVYLEIESGYHGLLLSTNSKLHMIPMRMAAFYRNRLSDSSFWKSGVFGGIALRIVPDTTTSYATVPIFGFSSMIDFDNFLIEVAASIHRIESKNNFFDVSFRAGFRF